MTDTAPARRGLGPLQAVVDMLRDGVAVLDADGTVCYLNAAGERLLGRRIDEMIGRPLRSALPAADELLDFLTRARDGDAPVTWRGRCTHAGPRLTVTAVADGNLRQFTFRPAGGATSEEVSDAERLRFLAHVTETMIGTLDTGESVTRLAELAVERLGDWAVVVVAGADGRPEQEGRAHRDPARRGDVDLYRDGRLRVTTPTTPIAVALRTGEPVQVTSIDELPIAATLVTEEVRTAWRRLDTTSALVVPLRARGQTFGALAVMNTGARAPHSTAEITTAVEVARRGALALDNARLYGRQLDVAETLQRSLLTAAPRTGPERPQIAVRYRPAGSHQAVGGDWYDAFVQPDGAVALVIGDVVGHNVEAAAAMGQIRSMLRALAHDRPDSPARTLVRLDRVLTGLHMDTMATVLLARVDQGAARGTHILRWSSAGHVPPLVLHPDGRVRVLDTPPERLLGTGLGSPRHDHEALLHPGDTALLVTDGLVEHGRRDIDAGLARVTAVLGDLAAVPIEELCDRLLDRLVTGRADDDIAVLAVRCPRSARRS